MPESMPDLLTSAWAWLILGLVLIAIEALAPGIFMVWFGVAAILTAFVDWAFGLSWQANMVVFAVLSVLSVLAGWQFTRRRDEEIGDTPMLNRRLEALVGRTFPLDRAIVAGEGRVRVGDTVWRVTGPELPAGTPVRVARVAGTSLVVEPAETGPE
jgi:membrane protein implicated in regulation of membrane protease activity